MVTTSGQPVARDIQAGGDYEVPHSAVRPLLKGYQETGYGYTDYLGQSRYGVSLISHDWLRNHVHGRQGLNETYFARQAWASLQDVFAFRKQLDGRAVGAPARSPI